MRGVCNFCKTLFGKLSDFWRKLERLTMRDGNPMTNDNPPYEECLNCGAKLSGMFCHRCGQQATLPVQKMSGFMVGYFKNMLSLDSQAFPTLCNMIFHPGRVAKEFASGHYVSYLHPLQLNFFLLVVLITLFSLIGTDTKVQQSFVNLTNEEMFTAEMTLSNISKNSEYLQQVQSSPRTTVKLFASKRHLEIHNQTLGIFEIVDDIYIEENGYKDTLLVNLPKLLIDNGALVETDDIYHFSRENNLAEDIQTVDEMADLWVSFTSLLFKHFPLFILLTTPFLALSLFLIIRRRNYSKGYYYIFALYYLAFVELLFMVIYIVGQFVEMSNVHLFYFIALSLYMAVAIRRAFDIKSWFRAVVSGVLVNVIYTAFSFVVIAIASLVLLVFCLV